MQLTNRWRTLLMLTLGSGCLIYLILSQQVMADMFSWLKKKELQLSPKVAGQILLNGKPVPGLTVLRDLHYGDELYTDKAVTDSDGHFSFPTKTIKIRNSMFDTDVKHSLYVEKQSEVIKFFAISSLNTLDFNSFNVLLKNMTCELTHSDYGLDLKPDPSQPGIYLGAISKCSFADESVVTNKEKME